MDFSGENEETFPINLEGVVIPLNNIVQAVVVERPRTRCIVLGVDTESIGQSS